MSVSWSGGSGGPGVEEGLGPGGAGAYEAAGDQEKIEAEAEGDVDEEHAHEAEGDVDDVSRSHLADNFGNDKQARFQPSRFGRGACRGVCWWTFEWPNDSGSCSTLSVTIQAGEACWGVLARGALLRASSLPALWPMRPLESPRDSLRYWSPRRRGRERRRLGHRLELRDGQRLRLVRDVRRAFDDGQFEC